MRETGQNSASVRFRILYPVWGSRVLSYGVDRLPSMRPADIDRITVQEAVDRYIEMVRAKADTGVFAPGTAEVYSRDVATFAALAGPDLVLDDLAGHDLDTVLLRFA